MHLKRKLGYAEPINRDSLTFNGNSAFEISSLKNRLKSITVALFSEDENLLATQAETPALTFSDISDNESN
jgi:predicted enzyme involved in methoxymalonyl-ACP biosynthesis